MIDFSCWNHLKVQDKNITDAFLKWLTWQEIRHIQAVSTEFRGSQVGGGGQNAEADLYLGDTCWTGQTGQTGLGLFMAHREGGTGHSLRIIQGELSQRDPLALPEPGDTKGLYHQRKGKWEVNLLSPNPRYNKANGQTGTLVLNRGEKEISQRTYNLAPALTSIFSLPLHSLGGLKISRQKFSLEQP